MGLTGMAHASAPYPRFVTGAGFALAEIPHGAVQSRATASGGAHGDRGLHEACQAVIGGWGRERALSADVLAREALLGSWLAAHYLR